MIGIIGAMASEVDGLKAMMKNVEIDTISSVKFYKGTLEGKEIVVAEAGVGKVNAAVTAQTMILKYNTESIINIGVAGGLDKSLSIGDVVIATKTAEHDMDTTPLGDEPGFITGLDKVYMECDGKIADTLEECTHELGIHTVKGVIVSGDQFICTNEQREKLIKVFSGAAAEMEGAAIGHVCTMNGVKFGILRAVSDGANSDSEMDFPTFAKMAAENSIKIIDLYLKKC